jgi:hypothetical protein
MIVNVERQQLRPGDGVDLIADDALDCSDDSR